MINWVYFPKSSPPPQFGISVVALFEDLADSIDSTKVRNQHSDVVMSRLRPGLEELGFRVEKGKTNDDKIVVPVLFGRKGKILKCFNADAHARRQPGFWRPKLEEQLITISFLKISFKRA